MAGHENRYAEFFEASSIFREVHLIYRFFLYFNLPFDSIVRPQIAPVLVKEVSNENEEEKTSISALLKEFADDSPMSDIDHRLRAKAEEVSRARG